MSHEILIEIEVWTLRWRKIVILVKNQINNRCSWKLRSINTSFRVLCDFRETLHGHILMKFTVLVKNLSEYLPYLQVRLSSVSLIHNDIIFIRNFWRMKFALKIWFAFNNHHFWSKTDKKSIQAFIFINSIRSQLNRIVSDEEVITKKWSEAV